MRFQNPIAVMFAGALAAACTSAPLGELQDAKPKGSDVSQALAEEYRRFAAAEVTEMIDLKDGEYFVHKGLRAARGGEPAPERVANWQLSETDVSRLQAARHRLAAALANRPEAAAPRTAAYAQVGFDCWIEQQEEAFQPQDIDGCRSAFIANVDALERRADYPHSVFFALDAAALTPDAKRRIGWLAARALRLDVPRVTVLGHADTTGGTKHNLKLSLKRADAVERALIAAGLPADRVGVAAAGEKRPRVATGDGVAEAQNRRVEVLFQPAVGW